MLFRAGKNLHSFENYMPNNCNRGRSLKLWLPILLLLAVSGAAVLYFFVSRLHQAAFENQAEFEKEFNRNQRDLASRILADVDRWVQRNDMQMVQVVFGELTSIPELKAAVFLDNNNKVVASTRKDEVGQALGIDRLGVKNLNKAQLQGAIQGARQNIRGTTLFSEDRNGFVACYPISLPSDTGKLEMRPRGIILFAYDLSLDKTVSLHRLQTGFLISSADILPIALALGFGLQILGLILVICFYRGNRERKGMKEQRG